MTQYINKDVLVAEIDRRIKELREVIAELGNYAGYECGAVHDIYLYKAIRSFIDTLEVKEVDLEEEIKQEYLKRRCYVGKDNMLVTLNEPQFNEVTKHFFNLGLKAQKGE